MIINKLGRDLPDNDSSLPVDRTRVRFPFYDVSGEGFSTFSNRNGANRVGKVQLAVEFTRVLSPSRRTQRIQDLMKPTKRSGPSAS